MTAQRLPSSLTPLEAALSALLSGLAPVAPVALPLSEARCCVAAEMPPVAPYPTGDIAANDGWAVRADDAVGASSYSPLPLATLPPWVDAGDVMPQGCDCVLDAAAVDTSGAIAEIVAEPVPGQGVRRAGSEIAGGGPAIASGLPIRARDLLIARSAGLENLNVRCPRLCIINLPGGTATARLVAQQAHSAGADVTEIEAAARDADSLTEALQPERCDLLLTIGGSGVGRNDATVSALARRGQVLTHGVALQPGRTAAVGRIGTIPVVALPGAPDHALAAWLALVLPALDRLSGRNRRKTSTRLLARKIASSVGLAEIALLEEKDGAWLPLATGDLPLQSIARADAWLLVPGSSEGFAAGTPADAYLWSE